MIDLCFDLETIPAGEMSDDDVKVPANYKKPESIQKYIEENRDEQYAKRGLNGLTCEICSIAYSIDGDTTRVKFRTDAMPETELLTEFWNDVKTEVLQKSSGRDNLTGIRWIGHNLIEFDLRILAQRSAICGVMPQLHIPLDARHGQGVYDTMKAWAGWKGYVSLEELSNAFGFRKSDLGLTGADVWPLWQAGEYAKIGAYNADDVNVTWALYTRMKHYV